MSKAKAEEKTIELMKKAKDFIPDGGYSEKELNLAFFMFINGYRQAEKDLELTVDDIMKIDALLIEMWNKPSNKDGYQEVLKRFKDYGKEKKKHLQGYRRNYKL